MKSMKCKHFIEITALCMHSLAWDARTLEG